MEFTFIKKTGFVLSLLATVTLAHAGAHNAAMNNDKIPCPQLSDVQQAASKLDATEQTQGMYIAYTSQPVFHQSELPWFVGLGVNATTAEEALLKGKETVQNIHSRMNEYAYETAENQFVCLYQPGNVVAVAGDIGIDEPSLLFKRR
jgi:hypothetical protein